MALPVEYAQIIRELNSKGLALEQAIARKLRRILQRKSDSMTRRLIQMAGTGDTLTLLDAQRFGFAQGRLMPEFQLELFRAVTDAMREAGMLAGSAEYEIMKRMYKGELPVRIATELERMLFPTNGLIPVIETLKASQFRGSMMLSQKIWNIMQGKGAALDTINYIVTRGVERGISATKLAKALEGYLAPGKEFPLWAGRRVTDRLFVDKVTAKALGMRKPVVALRNMISGAPVGPLTPKGTVSYNAFRLARTEIGRSYRAMHVVRAIQMERAGVSFIRGIKWNLSGSHYSRVPGGDICDDWAEQDIDDLGPGVYVPQNVPQDHPNGMCYTTDELMDPADFQRQVEQQSEQGVMSRLAMVQGDPTGGIDLDRLGGYWLGSTAKGAAAGKGFFGEEAYILDYKTQGLYRRRRVLTMEECVDKYLSELELAA